MGSCIIVDLSGLPPKFNLENIVEKYMSKQTHYTNQKTYHEFDW